MAAEVARQAGAELIGLGGFTSVVSMGGVALPQEELPPITSGNSLTVAATLIALKRACRRRGVELNRATAAVVGATGQTGRALAVMLAEEVGPADPGRACGRNRCDPASTARSGRRPSLTIFCAASDQATDGLRPFAGR